MPFAEGELDALASGDEQRVEEVFGYVLARCPRGDGKVFCLRDAEWGHPCDRDEHGEYECERGERT